MRFIQFWPFFLLFLIPVIIILYLLKQKAEDFPFSSLFLWREAYKNMEAARPWEKLKNNLLMILQILLILFLILALTSPYLLKGGSRFQNVVITIDTSGSMNADYDGKRTRFEQAVYEASSYVDSLREGTEVTILSMDKTATIEGANIKDKLEAKRVLEQIEVTDHVGNSNLALNFITSMAEQWEEYEAIFYSDSWIDLSQIQGRLVDLNSQGPNLCIEYVSYGYQEDGNLTVLVRVDNPSPYFFESDVNLYIDGEIVDIQKVSLESGENEVMYFEGIEPQGTVIKAELHEKDHLLSDNTAYALLQSSEEKQALLISEQNIFIERAISLVPGVELYKTTSPENIDEQDTFDLYIFDGVLPKTLPPEENIILIHPPGNLEGIAEQVNTLENVMLTAGSHEAVRYMENYSFGVTRAQGFQTPLWAKSFFKSGAYTVGYLGDYQGRKIGVIGFDFHNSDFPLQTEFPIFIHNLIGQCLERNLVIQTHYKTGDMLELNSDPSGSDIILTMPSGESLTLSPTEHAKTYDYFSRAGLYQVTQQSKNGEKTAFIIVDFPTEQESKIQPSHQGGEGSQDAARGAGSRGGQDLGVLCIILVVLLLCVEWMIYIKRV